MPALTQASKARLVYVRDASLVAGAWRTAGGVRLKIAKGIVTAPINRIWGQGFRPCQVAYGERNSRSTSGSGVWEVTTGRKSAGDQVGRQAVEQWNREAGSLCGAAKSSVCVCCRRACAYGLESHSFEVRSVFFMLYCCLTSPSYWRLLLWNAVVSQNKMSQMQQQPHCSPVPGCSLRPCPQYPMHTKLCLRSR